MMVLMSCHLSSYSSINLPLVPSSDVGRLRFQLYAAKVDLDLEAREQMTPWLLKPITVKDSLQE